MDGHGALLLPNGGEYSGNFTAGRRNGFGKYIDRTGTVFESGFQAGVLTAQAVLSQPMALHIKQFRRKVESYLGASQFSRVFASTVAASSDLRIGVMVDRRPLPTFTNALPLYYTSVRLADEVRIFPDDRRLLDAWRGHADVQIDVEQDAVNDNLLVRSFLDPATRYSAVPILIDIENSTSKLACH